MSAKQPRQTSRILLEQSAELLVASRLCRLGHAAGLAPKCWRTKDVLVEGEEWSIRVRASTKGPAEGWMVRGIPPDDRLFVALVDYNDSLSPVVYVLTSEKVWQASHAAALAYRVHRPHSKEAYRWMLHDPMPQPIKDLPATSMYETGWLENHREAWSLLPAPRSKPEVAGSGGEGAYASPTD